MKIDGAKAKIFRRARITGSALALLAFMAPKTISAAPQTLYCLLTDIEIKSSGAKFESQVGAEKRAIAVIFDDDSKALTLKQQGVETPLEKVAISQTSMTGALWPSYGEGVAAGVLRIRGGVPGQRTNRKHYERYTIRHRTAHAKTSSPELLLPVLEEDTLASHRRQVANRCPAKSAC